MQSLINLDDVNTKIITIRNQNVILDSDVAQLYGVQTMRINEAVRNNPKKFPEGYILSLQSVERQELIENFDRFENLKHSISTKAFTERGLYMLATILKSDRAIEATIAIVETFAKLKQLSNNIAYLNSVDPEVIEPEVIESTIEKSSGLLNDLFFSELPITSAETSVEFNLGFMKGKRTIKSDVSQRIDSRLDELERMLDSQDKRLEQLLQDYYMIPKAGGFPPSRE